MATDDVLIVGAGPTGLMLAIQLARHGVRPRVVDAGPSTNRESRAVAVVARSLEILDDLDLAHEAIGLGQPLHGIHFYRGARTLADMDLTVVDSPFPMDLCIPQWQTVDLLRRRATDLGVEVEWETALTAFEAGADDVAVEFGTGKRSSTRWLVGCDGSHSTVRRLAGIDWQRQDLDRGFILGDVRAGWDLPRDRFHAIFGPGGVVAVFPMPQDGVWRVLASTSEGLPPERPGLGDFAARIGAETSLSTRISDLQWASSFAAREGLAGTFRSGRVLLAGDAAHSHSPIGGQGMNVGIQDAYNLGWKLAMVATGGAGDFLLDSYQTERRPVARAVVETTSTATRLATLRPRMARWARGKALRIVGGLDAVQRRFAQAIAEHQVSYHESPTVGERWAEAPPTIWSGYDNSGPAAGELAPDAYLETDHGPVALRHRYRDPGHHLVLFAGDTTDRSALASWRAAAGQAMRGRGSVHLVTRSRQGFLTDPRSEAHNRYGVRRPSVYLLRPDKYVGFRTDTVDFGLVDGYFRRLTRTS
ncbi:FAD-dependent monooxygenase [Plantactinospora sp. DSM 117369]